MACVQHSRGCAQCENRAIALLGGEMILSPKIDVEKYGIDKQKTKISAVVHSKLFWKIKRETTRLKIYYPLPTSSSSFWVAICTQLNIVLLSNKLLNFC